ncbi:glycerophosphodiester phosphodiesterase [Streptomyces endophytica]|uniref:Glycerophosphodiester phosphodiesterase family protein n=1 Tax=Streptomyces endophytica TaxID=2991496 RepID=A0ABY6P8V8_9ACTN|nr:glycerophosphodiester phosphodiesterase family protein [Streptomyces endophytica]UZJ30246.1 glycerophosphodiester phosphodiesterase family protein [Streptomyces endophytica]
MHDTTLDRTTDAAKVFPGRALASGGLHGRRDGAAGCRSWFGKRFAGERIPTLAAYLRRLDRNGQRLLLEIKSPKDYPGIEAQVVRELRSRGWLDRDHVRSRLVVQSFSVTTVKAVHELVPQVRTGILERPMCTNWRPMPASPIRSNPRMSALSSRWLAARSTGCAARTGAPCRSTPGRGEEHHRAVRARQGNRRCY